jgi:hypothetical protein
MQSLPAIMPIKIPYFCVPGFASLLVLPPTSESITILYVCISVAACSPRIAHLSRS